MVLLIMSKSRHHQNFYNIIVDFVNKPVLLRDSPRIHSAIVAFEWFYLSRSCSRMFP